MSIPPTTMILVPKDSPDASKTFEELVEEPVDVLYITRLQKERWDAEQDTKEST